MRILVVDDQDINRSMLQFMLESEGYSVKLAENGQEALDVFDDYKPDIVLLDVVMPLLDGYQTAPLLKAKANEIHLPIIFITALDDQEAMLKCLEVGGDDFLTKPFDRVMLTAKVRSHQRIRDLSQSVTEQNQALVYFQNQTEREYKIVEHIFSNAVKNNHFVEDILQYHISPASMFSGDLLLANRGPTGSSYVLLGDFTGHGLAAAVGALPTAQTFFAMTIKGMSVGDIAYEINAQLLHILPDDMFCAASIIELSSSGKAISIWSGGIPDVFVVNKQKGIRKRISAQHMALGILEEHEFDKDSYHYEVDEDDQIISYTDGVIEAHDQSGNMFGQERLEQLYQDTPNCDLNHVITHLSEFCGDAEQSDDVSIFQINCIAADKVELKSEKIETIPPIPWRFTLTVSPDEIRNTDPVSHMVDMVSAVQGMGKHRSTLFLILAELYNNALDHGLLRLSSAIKDGEDGFFEYYMQRQSALESLAEGYIILTASYLPASHIITYIVEDSGIGFDYENRPAEKNLSEQHGRGIHLLEELCSKITYEHGGSTVSVEYSVLNSPQEIDL